MANVNAPFGFSSDDGTMSGGPGAHAGAHKTRRIRHRSLFIKTW